MSFAPLSAEEQDLLTWLLSSIPRWLWMDDPRFSQQEIWAAAVKSLIRIQRQGEDWVRATYILTSTDVWLNQHARDRASFRQESELDPDLRQRLRTVPDVITRSAILSSINGILSAAGLGPAAMIELPRDGAWLGTYAAMAGIGGTFVQDGTTTKFTPLTLPWPEPPFRSATTFPELRHKLIITGATAPANNGTRLVTGLDVDAALVTNASGVAGSDPLVTWEVRHYDGLDNLLDGFARSYAGRGWRMARRRPRHILVILPFGTTAGTQASVEEALRLKKAGGFAVLVERRMNP